MQQLSKVRKKANADVVHLVVYLLARATAKPEVVLTSMAKALKLIHGEKEIHLIAGGSCIVGRLHSRGFHRFDGMASKIMLLSVTAWQALWLKPCLADSSSKKGLCSILFKGEILFGALFEKAIRGKWEVRPL